LEATRLRYRPNLNELVKRLLESIGLDLHVVRRRKADTPYETVRPNATYAPWIADRSFREVYERIRTNTLVDELRCYELWQLVTQSAKLDGGSLLEVGVWRGGTGALIASAARRSGVTDDVYLCDTFAGVVKASRLDPSYRGGEHSDTSRSLVERLITGLGLSGVRILTGIFPEDTASQVEADRFRFAHVDVDVYESARSVTEWLWPRLVTGGMIVYDDYGFATCPGVTKAVDEQRDKQGRLVFHNLNGHAVVLKISS
jgi:O-methyltransferase